ncbi:MAG TPA: GNAT family N-acetyltransferase [Polyangiaceae bacterium LLY-WYZ-15_(1-7)]|nr:GNAT family N-acetyltransferase [Myxococcales bacterium]MAT29292.1 GNAT family N-acetyltransferase [Sandaracinus sp.]HJL05457.1 GNAT family N-acetyltransferase [Polyangiaceae bacterium LLY-WYZ-15_(1-7)]HJL12806.1 GNAT family N-acetyltransferase [Polyangiaceae bacterium LLY-WYZ-15_(1-7)]HJL25074.1 GNAT family N-acetyltransferase [Polyangiaceae bacterium LLY-WYZ-15_(1-7)]
MHREMTDSPPAGARVRVRPASPDDAAAICGFIQELADYEKEPDAVEATPETLRAQMESAAPPFECWIGELDGAPVGFALTFRTYSTWRARPGLWLEDFYVTPAARGAGVGDALFTELARVCVARGYGRLELTALDWNELAHRFYEKRGMKRMDEWTTWRIDGAALEALAR